MSARCRPHQNHNASSNFIDFPCALCVLKTEIDGLQVDISGLDLIKAVGGAMALNKHDVVFELSAAQCKALDCSAEWGIFLNGSDEEKVVLASMLV